MALNLPDNATEVVQRAKTDVLRAAPTSNPFLKNSWLGALVTGYANRVYDFYLQLKEAIKQSIPDTATGTYLSRWSNIWGINKLAASFASGQVVFTGTATTNIPVTTIVADSDGVEYETQAAVVISAQTIAVTSITRSGTTATVTTTSAHNLASEVPVTIAGAVETEYNGVQTITVTGTDTFTFTVAGSPSTPATGTITAAFTTALAAVVAVVAGIAGNQAADTELTLQSPIAGVDNSAYVIYGAVDGGVDVEDDDGLRERFLFRLQNPVALFNTAAITTQAKTVAGVTRVFVQAITPAVGQVTVYFMRDNEDPAIPSASEVTAVETALLEILPANTDPTDLIVAAPTAVSTDFTFGSLSPSTATMKAAIEGNLAQFFSETASVGTDITEDAYRSVIYNTVDTVTGDSVVSFALSAPTGTVTIATGQIGTLGAVTFP
jgi:uncharacterized phage protein gp47/JayE